MENMMLRFGSAVNNLPADIGDIFCCGFVLQRGKRF